MHATISYLRAGNPAGPRVVLVHGTPGSATAWADYLLDPPPGLELVALDRPGFDRSGPEAAAVSLEAQAAAVVALLPADGRPVVLLGHSLGGTIVARVAAEHPARVTALVLLAASLDPAQEKIHPMQWVGAWAPVRVMLPRVLRNANAELMALKPELEALAPMLSRITAKVLIVHGTKDDLVPVANVAFMQAHLSGSRCVQDAAARRAQPFPALELRRRGARRPAPGVGERVLSDWQSVAGWFEAVLRGMAEPWVIAVVLALTTLLLEDLAIAAGVALATQGVISWGLSFGCGGWRHSRRRSRPVCHGPGRHACALVAPPLRGRTSLWAREQLQRRLPSAVLLARVIPGLRLVTYTACGFVRVPLLPFTAWVLLAVTLWTAGLYG